LRSRSNGRLAPNADAVTPLRLYDGRMSKSKPPLPLTLAVFHMLLALFSKERHGDVMQQVKSDSEDAVKTDP
jgi:hypothetical protein